MKPRTTWKLPDNLRKELGKWLLDVAKYTATAVVITSMFGSVESKLLTNILGTITVILFLIAGLYYLKEMTTYPGRSPTPATIRGRAAWALPADGAARPRPRPGSSSELSPHQLSGVKALREFFAKCRRPRSGRHQFGIDALHLQAEHLNRGDGA